MLLEDESVRQPTMSRSNKFIDDSICEPFEMLTMLLGS